MNYSVIVLIATVAAASAATATALLIYLLVYPVMPVRIFGISIQGFLFRHQSGLAARLTDVAMSEFSTIDIAGKAGLNNETISLIDAHLDAFLKVRLKEKLPVVATFIGDKTVVKLKESMMEEIAILLPEVLKKYTTDLRNNAGVSAEITSLISNISTDRVEGLIRPVYTKMITTIPFIFGLLAAIVTFVLCVIFSLFI